MSGKFTYKVVEEHKDDPMQNVIEKGNISVQFTPYELQANIDSNKKLVKELKAKVTIEDAKKKNIEANHPFVKDLTDEQRFTVHMYEEAMSVCRHFPKKIAEFEESIAEMEQEQRNIAEQVGIAIPKVALAGEPAIPEEKLDKPKDL